MSIKGLFWASSASLAIPMMINPADTFTLNVIRSVIVTGWLYWTYTIMTARKDEYGKEDTEDRTESGESSR